MVKDGVVLVHKLKFNQIGLESNDSFLFCVDVISSDAVAASTTIFSIPSYDCLLYFLTFILFSLSSSCILQVECFPDLSCLQTVVGEAPCMF